ncbi:MAG: trigger factor, partial [Chloroflexota bacterium]|nr:trigger factor [Chloroflexota bacterium]
MRVQTERLPGHRARLEIEVEQQRIDREMDRAYKRLANRVSIPGFRRGKAPRVLVERALGTEAILDEASREFIPDAIADAVEQEQLEPVAEPDDLDIVSIEPFTFKVTVPLVPTVTLGDYRSVIAERRPVEVTDEQVEEVISELREAKSSWVAPDPARPAREGDQLIVDIDEYVEDDKEGEQRDLRVVLGNGNLIEELESQLPGVEEGQDYTFTATLSDEHPDEDLRGKPARFEVKVKSVRERVLPELDDAFAQSARPGVASVAELRERVRRDLEREARQAERSRLVEDVIQQMVATSTVELPDVLVEREIDHQVQHMEEYLGQSNISLDQYLRAAGQTREELRESQRERARERLMRGLVLSEIAKAEHVAVEDADLEREVDRIAGRISSEERDEVRSLLAGEEWQRRLRSDLFDRKLQSHLVELATGAPLEDEAEEDDREAEVQADTAEAMAEGDGGAEGSEVAEPVQEVELEAAQEVAVELAPELA